MAEKSNASIGFEKQIRDAACVLWGHIPAAEYRKVIVGLIFLLYVSNTFEKRYNELVADDDGFEDEKDAYLMENIFFVPEKARWSVISAAAHTPEIGTVIDEAMRAIEDENKTLKGEVMNIVRILKICIAVISVVVVTFALCFYLFGEMGFVLSVIVFFGIFSSWLLMSAIKNLIYIKKLHKYGCRTDGTLINVIYSRNGYIRVRKQNIERCSAEKLCQPLL